MKRTQTLQKSPNDKLDYTFKWKSWLEKDSDAIDTSESRVESGVTLVTETNDGDSATLWISGGTDGCTYKITNKITTTNSEPRIKEGYFYLKVVDPETRKETAYT